MKVWIKARAAMLCIVALFYMALAIIFWEDAKAQVETSDKMIVVSMCAASLLLVQMTFEQNDNPTLAGVMHDEATKYFAEWDRQWPDVDPWRFVDKHMRLLSDNVASGKNTWKQVTDYAKECSLAWGDE